MGNMILRATVNCNSVISILGSINKNVTSTNLSAVKFTISLNALQNAKASNIINGLIVRCAIQR